MKQLDTGQKANTLENVVLNSRFQDSGRQDIKGEKFTTTLEDINFQMNNIDPAAVKHVICQDEYCRGSAAHQGQEIHRHVLEDCKPHAFCISDALDFSKPVETQQPWPLPMGGYKMMPDHKQKLIESKFGSDGPIQPGTKLVVTRYAHDKWLAQMYGLDLENFPSSSNKIPKQVIDQLRDYIPSRTNKQKQRQNSEERKQEGADRCEENTGNNTNKVTFIPAAIEQSGGCGEAEKILKSRVQVYPEQKKVTRYVDMINRDYEYIQKQCDLLNNGQPLSQAQLVYVKQQMSKNNQEEKAIKLNEPLRHRSEVNLLRPNKMVTARLNSRPLQFMGRLDIEIQVNRRQAYLKNMANLRQQREDERVLQAQRDQKMKDMESPNKWVPTKEKEKSGSKASVRKNYEAKSLDFKESSGQKMKKHHQSNVQLRCSLVNPLSKDSTHQATFSQIRCKSGKYTRTATSKTTGLSDSNKFSQHVVQSFGHLQQRLALQNKRRCGKIAVRDLFVKLEHSETAREIGRYDDVGEIVNLENLGGSHTTRGIVPPFRLNLATLNKEERNSGLTTERVDLQNTDRTMRGSFEMAYGSTILKSPVATDRQNFHLDPRFNHNVQTSLLNSALMNTEQAWTTSADTRNVSVVKPLGVPKIAEQAAKIEAFNVKYGVKQPYSSRFVTSFESRLKSHKSTVDKKNNRFTLEKEFQEPEKAPILGSHLQDLMAERRNPQTLSITPRNQRFNQSMSSFGKTLEQEEPQTRNYITRLASNFVNRHFSNTKDPDEEQYKIEKELQEKNEKKAQLKNSSQESDIISGNAVFTQKKVSLALCKLKSIKPAPPTAELAFFGNKQPLLKKKLIKEIMAQLDQEIEETPCFDKFLLVELPDYELTKAQFACLVTSMDQPYFWLEKALASKKEGKIDTCVSYYLNGVRHTPTSNMLIYNLANSYKKLGKLKNAAVWFTLGCQLQPRWVDGQVGLGMTQFQMGEIDDARKNIDQARSDFKTFSATQNNENDPFKPLFTLQNLSIFLAIVSKTKGDYKDAERKYKHWMPIFKNHENIAIAETFFSMFFVPLMEDKKLLLHQLTNIKEYFNVMVDQDTCCSQLVEELRLSHYTLNNCLNWDTYPDTLLHLLRSKYFFRRFAPEALQKHLKGKKLQVYKKDDIVFLNRNVVVIVCGSVLVKNHPMDALHSPKLLYKAKEGDVLGYDQGDFGVTADPLTWLITFSEHTEVIMFPREDFQELWNLQKNDIERQMVLQQLECTVFFQQLSTLTKYSIVYEVLHEEIYYPGEQIMSIHQRSPLCKAYCELYKDSISGLKARIEANRLRHKSGASFQTVKIEKNQKEKEAAMAKVMHAGMLVQPKKEREAKQARQKKGQFNYLKQEAKVMMKQMMLNNKRAMSFIDPSKSQKNCIVDFNFSYTGTTRLAKQSTITFQSINDSPERPLSAGSSEPCLKENHNPASMQQLNMFEKLVEHDYQHQLKKKEIYNHIEQKRFAKNCTKQIVKKSPKKKLIFACQEANTSNWPEGDVIQDGDSEESEEEIDKQDTRKSVLVLSCERLLISISKARSSPSQLLMITETAQMLERRFKVAKKLNKRLQQYMGMRLKKPLQHSPLKDLPTLSDFLEQVDQIRRCLFIITEQIKDKIKADGIRNDFFDKQKQVYKMLLEMETEVEPSFKDRRIEANAIHFIAQGEVCLSNDEIHMPQIILTPGQSFGFSDIGHCASLQYFGDLRAFMTPVKTYKVFQEDLERVMTYPELVKVRASNLTNPQMKTALNAVAHQFEIHPDAFERY